MCPAGLEMCQSRNISRTSDGWEINKDSRLHSYLYLDRLSGLFVSCTNQFFNFHYFLMKRSNLQVVTSRNPSTNLEFRIFSSSLLRTTKQFLWESRSSCQRNPEWNKLQCGRQNPVPLCVWIHPGRPRTADLCHQHV